MALVDLEGFGQGDRERFEVGVTGTGVEFDCEAGVLAALVALWPPSWVMVIFGGEGEGVAVDRLEGGGEVGDGSLVTDSLGGDCEGRAVGWVDHEVGLIDVDLDRADPQGDAADDLGDLFGVSEDVGIEGVDVEGDADDDGAVVIGPSDRGSNDDEAQWGALKGAGHIDLAGGVEGVGAGTGGDV